MNQKSREKLAIGLNEESHMRCHRKLQIDIVANNFKILTFAAFCVSVISSRKTIFSVGSATTSAVPMSIT